VKNCLIYLGFSVDYPLEEAVKRFEERYGYAPVDVVVDKGPGLRLLRVGPVEPLVSIRRKNGGYPSTSSGHRSTNGDEGQLILILGRANNRDYVKYAEEEV